MRLLRLTFVFLAALLVFASQARAAHELSHLFDGRHVEVCDTCLAFTGLEGTSLPALPVIPAKPATAPVPARLLSTSAPAVFFASFLARAPPFFLC